MLTGNAVRSMRERVAMGNGNALKLGLFGMNCSSGRTLTTVPERWTADWQHMVAVARMADACGLDFLLPIGRWKGYGGVTDFQGTTLETLTWATGLLAKTERITVFGTVHTPLFHPVIAAKQMVTADVIGEGRFGLNVVCGWNEDEFEMFGIEQKDHTDRYRHGREWIEAIKQMWSSSDEFDFDGSYFHLRHVRAKPKPFGGTRPMIMNAGRSVDGQAFAIENCDAYFTGIRVSAFDEVTGEMTPNVDEAAEHVREVRARAAAIGRDIGVFTRGELVVRPTRREAVEYWRYAFEEYADLEAVDNFLALNGVTRETHLDDFELRRKQYIRGFPIIGDPDSVARMLHEFSRAGFDGIALSLVNYLDEFPFVRDELLPRLQKMGLRT